MNPKTIAVTYGPNELTIESGTAKNVAELREQVQEVLNLPEDALVKIDDKPVDKDDEAKTEIPETAKEVTFVKQSGSKAR